MSKNIFLPEHRQPVYFIYFQHVKERRRFLVQIILRERQASTTSCVNKK
jgi:hypothetical protein